MPQAIHKQLKKANQRLEKTKKSLEEKAVRPPARVVKTQKHPVRLDSDAPGFNHFCGQGKKNRLAKKYKNIK
jgi:hypothetical protein